MAHRRVLVYYSCIMPQLVPEAKALLTFVSEFWLFFASALAGYLYFTD